LNDNDNVPQIMTCSYWSRVHARTDGATPQSTVDLVLHTRQDWSISFWAFNDFTLAIDPKHCYLLQEKSTNITT